MKKNEEKKGAVEQRKEKEDEREVIAYRKSCDAKGTGLSHYILMDKDEN